MIINLGKKIICIKDIPSNIIEEAVFILKSNVVNNKETKYIESTKEIILNEAEEIIDEYSKKFLEERENNIVCEETLKKNLKKEIIYIVGLIIIMLVCIFIIF